MTTTGGGVRMGGEGVLGRTAVSRSRRVSLPSWGVPAVPPAVRRAYRAGHEEMGSAGGPGGRRPDGFRVQSAGALVVGKQHQRPARRWHGDQPGFADGDRRDWSVISSGEFSTVAVRNDGTLWSWGNNGFGQLGDGTVISHSARNRSAPRPTGRRSRPATSTWSRCAATARCGPGDAIGRSSSVTARRTMRRPRTDRPARPMGHGGWRLDHSVAVRTDGTLWAGA